VGEQFDTVGELDMSITLDVEHHQLEAMSLQELCKEVIEPTVLDFDDDVLFVEYESFSCEFDINECFDEGFYAAYESFSFDPIIPDILFESYKSKFVEPEVIVTENLIEIRL